MEREDSAESGQLVSEIEGNIYYLAETQSAQRNIQYSTFATFASLREIIIDSN